MGRVINTASTGKERNQMRRTIAEMLRRLSQKSDVDDETKDMLATVVYCLRAIDAGIESSASAWEKRGYWMKAEGLQREWAWVGNTESDLLQLLQSESWDDMPDMMIKLFPRFTDVNVTKYTRRPEDWQGAYHRLMQETDA